MIAGFDEAGRGSVIGPLLTSLVLFDDEVEKEGFYKELNDSKKLSRKKRERLFESIRKRCPLFVKKIEAKSIDKFSINYLERNALRELIKKASEKYKIKEVYVDLFEKKGELLRVNINNIKIIAEHKADSKYKVVSAASIVSKVLRDQEIDRINKICNVGSGYPSDKKTIEGIIKCGDKIKKEIRTKWKTIKRINKKSIMEYL